MYAADTKVDKSLCAMLAVVSYSLCAAPGVWRRKIQNVPTKNITLSSKMKNRIDLMSRISRIALLSSVNGSQSTKCLLTGILYVEEAVTVHGLRVEVRHRH